MAISEKVRQKFDQIEEELNSAIGAFPGELTVAHVRFARSLVLFTRAQLEIEDDEKLPLTRSRQPRATKATH